MLRVLVTGLKYPRFAAGLGGVWFVGRILYTIGYTSGDPAKRNTLSLGAAGLSTLGESRYFLVGGEVLRRGAVATFSTGYTIYEYIKEGL